MVILVAHWRTLKYTSEIISDKSILPFDRPLMNLIPVLRLHSVRKGRSSKLATGT